jgi:hypothetical protein
MQEQMQQREQNVEHTSEFDLALCLFWNNRGGRLERMDLTLQSPQCFAIAIIIAVIALVVGLLTARFGK